jgi:hypothetical protein
LVRVFHRPRIGFAWSKRSSTASESNGGNEDNRCPRLLGGVWDRGSGRRVK